jgi:hypothetical protein
MLRVLETRSMETVGGYRLVRTLGIGARSHIYLGHAGSRETPAGDRIAAIKVYRLATDDTSIDREIEALARASSQHLLELIDLATGPDGRPCLILPRLGSGTLARLLAVRGTVAPGEAVSILVPVVQAVQELHRVGVAHGAVASSSVLFDDRGAPVLARFGAASLIGDFPIDGSGPSLTPAELDAEPRAIADRAALQGLVMTVLDRLEPGSPRTLDALRQVFSDSAFGMARLLDIIDLLFALAPALPIRFDEAPLDSLTSLSPIRPGPDPVSPLAVFGPGSQTPTSEFSSSEPRTSKSPTSKIRVGTAIRHFTRLLSAARIVGVADTHPFAHFRRRVFGFLAPVRMPVWIAGGAGIAALVIALTVIPAARSETPAGSPGATPTSTALAPSQDAPSGSPRSSGAGAPAPGAAQNPEAPKATRESDDPVAAARALLSIRSKCFSAKSTTCFDSVDQVGSAMIEADRDLFRRLDSGAPLPIEATLDGFTPQLIQQWGDSAILQLVAADGSAASMTNPAPLLLVRDETGWRIRDLSLG